MTTTAADLEAHHRPTTTLRPHVLDWPERFADTLEEYDRTHRAWSLAHHALHEALAAVPRAEAEDTARFSATVRDGATPDKGGRADRARREVDAQAIRTAQAREAATASTDKLKQAIREHGDALVPAVVHTIRDAAEAYTTALARARQEVDAARARLRDACGLPTLVAPVLSAAGIGTPDLGTPEAVSWPVDPTASLLGRVARLDRDWSRATTSPTTAG